MSWFAITIARRTLKVFAHLTAEKVALYRAIMQVFTAAKARFALHLRVADVRGALTDPEATPAIDAAEVEAALEQLCLWGNLEAHPDNAEVATVEEFLPRVTCIEQRLQGKRLKAPGGLL